MRNDARGGQTVEMTGRAGESVRYQCCETRAWIRELGEGYVYIHGTFFRCSDVPQDLNQSRYVSINNIGDSGTNRSLAKVPDRVRNVMAHHGWAETEGLGCEECYLMA
jgi:hypothetical protein